MDCIAVRGNKATNTGKRLREGSHNKINLVCQAKMITNAPALFSKDSDTMSFVHHNGTVVLVLKFNDFRKFCQIAFHREYAIDDNELDALLRAMLEAALEVLHVVVFEFESLGEREPAAVDDGRMVPVVADYEIPVRQKSRDNTGVDRKSGSIAQRLFLSYKFSEFLFKCNMYIESSVKEAGSRTSGTVFLHRFDTCLHNAVITSKSSISIRPEHQHFVAPHFNLRSLMTFNLTEVGI